MISTASTDEIEKLLALKPRTVIVMHRNPDGDAIGSSLGWAHILTKANISTTVIAPDDFPSFLKWMPGAENIVVFEKEKAKASEAIAKCDLIFCLDFNSLSRIGDLEEPIKKAGKPMIVIDHHQAPEPFAKAYYVDDKASSTAELVYSLSRSLGWKSYVDRNAAICLYTGIVTDTGSFRYSSVSPDLMKMAAELMETGMDHTRVYDEIYDSNTEERLKLRGYALSEKLKLLPDAKAAYIYLTTKDLQKFNFQKGDTEGLVNYALSIKGVRVAGYFAEKDGIIKISLRSKGHYDVNKLARTHFKGGGHVNAAGGKSEKSMQETLRQFEEIVIQEAEQNIPVQ